MARFDDLAQVYDLLVAWDKRLAREAPFFDHLFRKHGVRDVLDAACGTGRHAVHFAQQGFRVVGTDISREMIGKSREHARRSNASVQFAALPFSEVGTRFRGRFDAVVCLGNSLAACGSAPLARNAVKNFAQALRPGGLLVIQILHFAAMRAAADRFEPPRSGVLDGTEYLLFKFFDLDRPSVVLNLNIFARKPGGKWDWHCVSNALFSPNAMQLRRMVRGAGFGAAKLYDNHQFEPFHRASDQLLLTALKATV